MKNKWIVLLGLAVFAAFFISSIVWESPLLLYIASAIPIFIVPFLPDLKTSQKLDPGRRGVEIVKLAGGSGEPEWLVVSFQPGTVYWNRKTLIIPYENAPTVRMVHADDYTAALTVLQYDLRRKRKNGRIGVSLANLSERTAPMPFTIHEVNRLIIPLTDLDVTYKPASSSAVASPNVELQA